MKKFLILLPLFLILFSCGGAPAPKSGASAGLGTGSGTIVANKEPLWVNSVDSVYPKKQYAAAIGFAPSRSAAEAGAFAALTAYFGQSIQVDSTIASSYKEAVTNGVTDNWIESTEINSELKTSASLDKLLGAEIKEVWADPNNSYYAVAVMEKAKSARLYNELIKANLKIIDKLTEMKPNEKNAVEGVIRYRFAAVVADINVSYSNVVRLLDAAPPDGINSGDSYRLEAQNIIRTIPISVRVANDRSGRIAGAFAKSISGLGFETNSGNSRYALIVEVRISPVELPNNPNKFSRIEVTANLTDTQLRQVLLPYNFNSREGHVSQSEAENRVVVAAERKINNEYADLFSEYLSSLIPSD